jgi:sec-independent protein translocase protein TatB
VFGVNGGELIILIVVVALVVGPERLPHYAEQLGRWARSLRGYVQDARQRVDDEVGDTGLDWDALDPRRYDPRRIVREALLDDPAAPTAGDVPPGRSAGPAPAATPAGGARWSDAPTPYDDEAT